MEDLNVYRQKIDEIDRQLTALFEARMDVCRRVGESFCTSRPMASRYWIPAAKRRSWRKGRRCCRTRLWPRS